MGTIIKRKNRNDTFAYVASVRRKGCPKAYRSFARLTDARDWVQKTEFKLASGMNISPSEAEQHTLAEAIDRFFLEELPKKPKVMAGQRLHLLWFKKQIGYRTLDKVTPALITEMKGHFLREKSRNEKLRQPQTWNRYLSALSCVFDVCIRDWQWLEQNPARRVRREREAPGRVRFLSDDERTRLLEACRNSASPNLYPLVVLTLSAGMRRGEVRRLVWSQIDLAKGTIILTQTKNKENRRVPIRGLALTLLREHARVRRIDTNLVFPGENRTRTGKPFALDNAWYRALEEAKISDFRFHDLRHTCASWLAMNGASLLEIAEVLGHKTLQMVKRYSHLAESHTAMVVERMNRKVFGE